MIDIVIRLSEVMFQVVGTTGHWLLAAAADKKRCRANADLTMFNDSLQVRVIEMLVHPSEGRAVTELNNADFYVQREKQERAMADQAKDPSIARIHLDMADHHAGLVRAGREISRASSTSRPILRLGAGGR